MREVVHKSFNCFESKYRRGLYRVWGIYDVETPGLRADSWWEKGHNMAINLCATSCVPYLFIPISHSATGLSINGTNK